MHVLSVSLPWLALLSEVAVIFSGFLLGMMLFRTHGCAWLVPDIHVAFMWLLFVHLHVCAYMEE